MLLWGKLLGVSDDFEALGLPPRPYLDPDTVQGQFRDLAARIHPDRCGGDPEPLARLNNARKTLLSDAARLRHLLDITFSLPTSPSSVPPDFQLFSLIGTIGRDVDTLVAKRTQAASALTAALLHQQTTRLESSIADTSKRLAALRGEILEDIRRLDRLWPDVSAADLAAISSRAAYCERWTESLRQVGVRLAGG